MTFNESLAAGGALECFPDLHWGEVAAAARMRSLQLRLHFGNLHDLGMQPGAHSTSCK